MRQHTFLLIAITACDAASPAPTPPAVSALDRCVVDVTRGTTGPVVRLEDGTSIVVSDASSPLHAGVVHGPVGAVLAPRGDAVSALVDGEEVIVAMRDERERPIARYRFALPQPAIAARCELGIRDLRWWDPGNAVILAVRYQLSDACDNLEPAIPACAVAVLPLPKDLPSARPR